MALALKLRTEQTWSTPGWSTSTRRWEGCLMWTSKLITSWSSPNGRLTCRQSRWAASSSPSCQITTLTSASSSSSQTATKESMALWTSISLSKTKSPGSTTRLDHRRASATFRCLTMAQTAPRQSMERIAIKCSSSASSSLSKRISTVCPSRSYWTMAHQEKLLMQEMAASSRWRH